MLQSTCLCVVIALLLLQTASALRFYGAQQHVRRFQKSSTPLHETMEVEVSDTVGMDMKHMSTSSLQGKALSFPETFPSLSEVKAAIPASDFVRSTPKSMAFAALDVATVAASLLLALRFLLPLAGKLAALGTLAGTAGNAAVWTVYALITGTLAIGSWVTAHECGHGAFSDNKTLQTVVGYVFHSLLLVPYFSWQRSHSVHHANTNHIEDG
jgi:hypothetical protein